MFVYELELLEACYINQILMSFLKRNYVYLLQKHILATYLVPSHLSRCLLRTNAPAIWKQIHVLHQSKLKSEDAPI